MRKGEIIILVREHIGFEYWSYAEYRAGILVNRYTVDQVKELMKYNQVITI